MAMMAERAAQSDKIVGTEAVSAPERELCDDDNDYYCRWQEKANVEGIKAQQPKEENIEKGREESTTRSLPRDYEKGYNKQHPSRELAPHTNGFACCALPTKGGAAGSSRHTLHLAETNTIRERWLHSTSIRVSLS
jgi:hypothetical protein